MTCTDAPGQSPGSDLPHDCHIQSYVEDEQLWLPFAGYIRHFIHCCRGAETAQPMIERQRDQLMEHEPVEHE
jgi:hypothetical protein